MTTKNTNKEITLAGLETAFTNLVNATGTIKGTRQDHQQLELSLNYIQKGLQEYAALKDEANKTSGSAKEADAALKPTIVEDMHLTTDVD